MFEEIIRNIELKKTTSLPGENAHVKMAPYRKKVNEALKDTKREPRKSSVLILLYPKNNLPHFVLMKRQEYHGVHSGQISFPGGKTEDGDVSLESTALREANEELGIPPNSVNIIRPLTPLFIPPSNFLVHPFLGFSETRPQFVRSEYEVNKIIEVPLNRIYESNVIKHKTLTLSAGFKFNTPYFDIEDEVVWGATSMIISELRDFIDFS